VAGDSDLFSPLGGVVHFIHPSKLADLFGSDVSAREKLPYFFSEIYLRWWLEMKYHFWLTKCRFEDWKYYTNI